MLYERRLLVPRLPAAPPGSRAPAMLDAQAARSPTDTCAPALISLRYRYKACSTDVGRSTIRRSSVSAHGVPVAEADFSDGPIPTH